jgi:glutamate-5-semialdehyde dehydrogenase
MTAPLKTIDSAASVATLMQDIGRRARKAARALALAPAAQKDKALLAMAKAIRAAAPEILAANEGDVAEARAAGVTGSFLDRLTLDRKRVAAMAEGLGVVAELKDPVGQVMAKWKRPNG